jgi:hypothetical protein
LPDLKLEKVRVKKPIVSLSIKKKIAVKLILFFSSSKTQHIFGVKGIYTQTNIEKKRSYTVEQWYNECHQDSNRPPQIKTDHTPTEDNNESEC